MFRRSIQILLAATLLALAAIVGYASLRLDGATEALAEAEALVHQGEHARAVALLDLCERGPSLQRDPALRQRLWRLRLRANTALENHRGALLDVENLQRESGTADLDLQLERIRLLTATGDGVQALQQARAFVGVHAEHGPGLAAAGAAAVAAYQPEFERLQAALSRDIGRANAASAQAAFASYVFRPDGDAEVAQSADALAALYAADTRLAAGWPTLLRELRALRDQVQEALDYCRRSLATADPASHPLLTWAAALDAGGRVDDMLLACEIHRRRTADEHTADAGLVAALALLRRDADAAAVATVDRWLPAPQLQPRLDAGTLGDAAPDLMLARVIAGWRRGDSQVLRRSLADIQTLTKAGLKVPVLLHTTAGMVHYLNYQAKAAEAEARNAENNLRYVTTLLQRLPPRDGWPDLLELVMRLRLDLLATLGASEAERLGVFEVWQQARPEALAPRLAFARHLLAQQQRPAAAAVLAEVTTMQGASDEVFDLQLQLARDEAAATGPDGAALLAQCLRRRAATPTVTQPIGYLLCAEAALASRHYGIARESALLAADAFPQVRQPRLLAIEAALAAGQATLAAEQASRVLQLFPPDARTALLALRAHRTAGLPTTGLLAVALPASPPDREVRVELLRAALAEAAANAVPYATDVLRDQDAPAVLRLLAAQALGRAGRPIDCRRLLESVIAAPAATRAAAQLDLARAATAWLVAAAAFRDDASLAPDAERTMARAAFDDPQVAPLLFAAATELAPTHGGTAQALATQGLALATPAQRNGAAYALLGRLAARQHQLRLAEEHWLAALAFADGRTVAADLARLLLAQGRVERALQVHQLVDPPADAALAARCGASEHALRLAREAAARDGADLLAQATLAALGQPSLADWRAADAPATDLRLEVLTLVQDADLAPAARTRAEALAAAEPGSATAQLLLARAAALAGDHAAAARLHLDLLSRAPGPLLWREVALAAAAPAYRLDPALESAVTAAVIHVDLGNSPTTLEFGLRRMTAAFARAGFTAVADDTRTKMWLFLPQTTVTTAADVAAVAALPNARDAWYVLDQALPGLEPPARDAARQQLGALAHRLVEQQGDDAADVYARVRHHLGHDGAYGCFVHFLLEHGDRFPALRPSATERRDLLLGQLELAGAGRDPGPWLERSVARLLQEQGAAATRADVDAALQRHPTCLPLWRARATLLVRLQAAATGIGDLRRVVAHADAPDEVLQFVLLAAATGHLLDADVAVLEALPAGLLASPDGLLARGLVHLRRGAADDAAALLARAPARDDGLHLYALALAHLQSRTVEGGARARAALQQLATDYPSSSLARHAGNFAAQLAPR